MDRLLIPLACGLAVYSFTLLTGCQENESVSELGPQSEFVATNQIMGSVIVADENGDQSITTRGVEKLISQGDAQALVDAIEQANRTGNSVYIKLEEGDYILPEYVYYSELGTGEVFTRGEVLIKSNVTIQGAGKSKTRIIRPDGFGGESFFVESSGSLTLRGVTLGDYLTNSGNLFMKQVLVNTGGVGNSIGATAKLVNVVVQNTLSTAVYNGGTMEIRNSVIRDNKDLGGSHPAGVISDGDAAKLEIYDSIITRNVVNETCGGVRVNSGILNITRSTISNNFGSERGGGLCIHGGIVRIRDSVFHDNSAYKGGAVANLGGILRATNVSFVRNFAEVGAGISSEGQGGITTLRNSTVAYGNQGVDPHYCSDCKGGGLYVSGSHKVNLENTILADNFAGIGPDCLGTITSWGGNLFGELGASTGSCHFTPSAADIIAVPLLSEFVDVGMAGKSHVPLLANSPAVDKARTNRCPNKDQLGNTRFDGNYDGFARCDIGAVEYID